MIAEALPRRLKTAAHLGVVTVAFAMLVCGCSAYGTPKDSYTGTPVNPPKVALNAILTDQNGRATHLLDRRARATFLFFGYTHCPDECPLALASLGHAYRQLRSADATQVRIVFVTVDPSRDTTAAIKRYVAHFDSHIVGLGGPHAALARVWDAYGVHVDPTSREIGHGDEIYAIDPTAHIVLIYPPDAAANDLAKDAAMLVSQ